jgi:hypothetical protein
MTAGYIDEPPTLTRKRATVPHSAQVVAGSIPLDVVPVLVVPRTEVPWQELSDLAAQLLRRIDGQTHAMSLVTATAAAPNETMRELASLAGRGLVRWAAS